MSPPDMPVNQPLTDAQVSTIRTIQTGVKWANELGKQLGKTDAADWDQRKMVVAALVYAAATASETKMSEQAWVELAIMAFRGVSIE